MKTLLSILGGICGFVLILVLCFGLELVGIEWYGFFGKKKADIDRKIFEQTQSYSHGKTQDLAKYFEEYNNSSSTEDKNSIATLIKMNFADFDETTIRNSILKNFLVNIRGY